MIYPDPDLEIPESLGNVHFVGVGGSGMSGIARMFVAAGLQVSGSDAVENANTLALRELGVRVDIGHDAQHLQNAQTIVVTGALWQDNPEYVAARERGLTVLHRSQALVWLSRHKRLIAVAGAHGKTTSTGMIVTALLELDLDPSFVNGGVIEALGISAAPGSGELFVIEADESDGSFLLYDTAIALITNVDPEHLDFYGSRDAFMQAFVSYAEAASELVVISADDPGALEVLEQLSRESVFTFGESESADVRLVDVVTNGPVSFGLQYAGETYNAQLKVPGHHNAVNAAGAFSVLVCLGIDPRRALQAIAEFGGTKRRFELHAEINGIKVLDDYAHHPTEVAALLTSARTVANGGRIIAVHQPHLYSRTRIFATEFAQTLESLADHTVVLAVCGAREDPEPGVTGELVSSQFNDPSGVAYIDDWQNAADYIAQIARSGDLVITMGCGDVYRMIPQITASLTRAHP
jgi:UDP-N-acetylmuramate--alanine ligase